jgi:hypothetical protein
VESAATTALRRRSNQMPITVPNYDRNIDRFRFGMLNRHHFGIVIAITSERRSPSPGIRSTLAPCAC